MFDTSNFPKEGHPSGIEVGVNRKVIGMFKDEAGGMQVAEFIGTKAKQYSYLMGGGGEIKLKSVEESLKLRSKNQSDLMIIKIVYSKRRCKWERRI